MTAPKLRLTILGCGSSGGVPRLGGEDGTGHWGACDPTNPKNRRRRCALLVERIGADGGVTRVLIDTGPDLHEQLLDARVATLDAVLYTHEHADHTNGLDDLRQVVINLRHRLDVWADAPTAETLTTRFGYAFETPPDSDYPAILNLRLITESQVEGETPIRVDGAGGPIEVFPFPVQHGRIRSLGFRVGAMAYLPDVSAMTPRAWEAVKDLDLWILDALRYDPHPSHVNLAEALEWIERAKPRRAILTNMHVDLDFSTVAAETPGHVEPAYDGMVIGG